jgi:predicted PurR-regulated permease PerM
MGKGSNQQMNLIDKRTASVLFTILVFTLLITLIYQARQALIVFIFAILFGYLLNPIVGRFQACLRVSRGLAIAATYLSLGIAIAAFWITAGPRIFTEGVRLGKELPALMENVASGQIVQQFGGQHGWDYRTQVQVQRFLADHRDVMIQYAQIIANRAAALAGSLMWLLLIPILAAFLLKDDARFANTFVGLIKGSQKRGFLTLVLNDLDAMLASFIRAQLLLAALALVAYTTFLLLARFPYSFALGATAGLLEFIPFVGPLVAILLIVGMAIMTGYAHWLMVVVFLIVWRGIQDYVTSPYLMKRGLQLHPLAVILGVLVGGEIAGVMGLFLSVPIIAGLRITWKAWKLEPGKTDVSPAQSGNLGFQVGIPKGYGINPNTG